MKDRIIELVHLLNKASSSYYNTGTTIMEDIQYDSLLEELKQLEEESGIILANSPTQNVGSSIVDKLHKITHQYPMLSLDKTKSVTDFKNFTNGREGIMMLKLDGLTVALTYEKGRLVRGETRGDGVEGKDITHHVKVMKGVPTSLPTQDSITVIGECIVDYNTFSSINQEEQFKHPRNLASGTLNSLDSQLTIDRGLSFIAYNIKGEEFQTKQEILTHLDYSGFNICPYYEFIPSDGVDFTSEINNLKDIAKDLSIPIDGLVMEYNDIAYGDQLGRTSKFFNNAIAYKFEDKTVATILRDIEWQTSRTGLVNPIAVFDKVELDGTEVRRASLHNLSYITNLKLHIGDTVTVYKANQIIPQILDNLGGGKVKVETPTRCPSCDSEVSVINNNGVSTIMCMNGNCKAQLVSKITHFASREAMNIEGLSESTIELFVNHGIIDSIPSLYRLLEYSSTVLRYKELNINSLPKFGKKKYDNLINALHKSKKCSKLPNFIYSLGIPQVGKATAKDLVDYFSKGSKSNKEVMELIANAKPIIFQAIGGIGEVTANCIASWFIENKTLYNELMAQIEIVEEEKVEVVDNILKDKKVYCTGKFSLGKSELKEKLKQLGCNYASGYSKSLDYLIAGGDTSKSSKVDKATKDGVKVLTEAELMRLFK